MSTDDAPEVIDVPVRRFEVKITLDDLLARLADDADGTAARSSSGPADAGAGARLGVAQGDAGAGAGADAGEDLHPEVAQRLRRIGVLAGQLRDELGQLDQIDPNIRSQLKQRPPAAG